MSAKIAANRPWTYFRINQRFTLDRSRGYHWTQECFRPLSHRSSVFI